MNELLAIAIYIIFLHPLEPLFLENSRISFYELEPLKHLLPCQVNLCLQDSKIETEEWKSLIRNSVCLKNDRKRDCSMRLKCVTAVQVLLGDLVNQTLQLHLHCKALRLQLLEFEIHKLFSSQWWLRSIPSFHKGMKRKSSAVLLVSIIAGMLFTVGAPISSPNSVTCRSRYSWVMMNDVRLLTILLLCVGR